MALRYTLPKGAMRLIMAAELSPLAARRPPVRVEFRKGADMANLCDEVLASESVELAASMGSGKSTVFPRELAMRTRSLVFHITPGRLMALDVYNYTEKQAMDGILACPHVFMEHPGVEVPRVGVVYAGAADFFAYIASPTGKQALQGAIVFLDEAHESDAYTHVIRTVCLDYGAARLICASATFEPSNFRRVETNADIQYETYPADHTPEVWDLAGTSNPWSAAAQSGNLLIFTDSRSQAELLTSQYRDHGFSVYRITSTTTDADFLQAITDLRDKRAPLVVFIADYSMRSCYTLDVNRIIDTGRVAYYDVEDGTPVKRTRPMYKLEAWQASGRGGKLPGSTVTYYRPEQPEPQAIICDLEGVEAQAAVLLYRVLGFQPPGYLSTCAYYSAWPKAEINDILRGMYPTQMYPETDKSEYMANVVTPDSVVMGLPSYAECTAGNSFLRPESRASVPTSRQEGNPRAVWTGLREVLQCQSHEIQASDMACYVADARVHNRRDSMPYTFPKGADSVVSYLRGRRYMHIEDMPGDEHDQALKLCLDRHNILTVDVCALRQALRTTYQDLVVNKQSPVVRQLVAALLEEASLINAERNAMAKCVNVLSREWSEIRKVEEIATQVATREQYYLGRIGAVTNHRGVHEQSYIQNLVEDFDCIDIDTGQAMDSQSSKSRQIERDSPSRRPRQGGGTRHHRHSGSSSDSSTHSRGSVGSTLSGEVTLSLPTWSGLKSVTYRQYDVDVDGEIQKITRSKVRPGKLVRALTGRDSFVT